MKRDLSFSKQKIIKIKMSVHLHLCTLYGRLCYTHTHIYKYVCMYAAMYDTAHTSLHHVFCLFVRAASRNWYFQKSRFPANAAMKPKLWVIEKLVLWVRVFGTEPSRNWYFALSRKPHRQAV